MMAGGCGSGAPGGRVAVDADGRGGDGGARLGVVVDGARPTAALPDHERGLFAAEFDDDPLKKIDRRLI